MNGRIDRTHRTHPLHTGGRGLLAEGEGSWVWACAHFLPVVFNVRNFFANIEAVSHQDRVMEIDWGMLFRNTTA